MEEKWKAFKEEIVGETKLKVRDMLREEGIIGRGETSQSTDIIEDVANKVKERIDEENNKEKRKNNIVMYVVPESEKEAEEERNEDDWNICRKIISEGLKVRREDAVITEVIRLGQINDNGRYRPLLVKFRNEQEKWKVLSQSKRLKESPQEFLRKVKLNKDLTKKERENGKILVEQLWEKRNQGDDTWQIKNGKLVKKTLTE